MPDNSDLAHVETHWGGVHAQEITKIEYIQPSDAFLYSVNRSFVGHNKRL